MKPIIKWVGGKTQILEKVLAKFPQTMRNYYEPFTGGGAVLLGLLTARAAGKIQVTGTVNAFDINPHLVNLYTSVRDAPAAVWESLAVLKTTYLGITGTEVNRSPSSLDEAKSSRESYYYWTRTRWNGLGAEERNGPAAAAMLIFLNKTSFRGVYREGPSGFNVPYGHNKTIAFPTKEELVAMSQLLTGVNFAVADCQVPLAAAGVGDFVYLDPPYVPEKATSFVGYVADGFTAAQHAALFSAVKGLVVRGATFLLSNSAVAIVTGAFPAPAFETTSIDARRAIHSKDPSVKTKEVLIRPAV